MLLLVSVHLLTKMSACRAPVIVFISMHIAAGLIYKYVFCAGDPKFSKSSHPLFETVATYLSTMRWEPEV